MDDAPQPHADQAQASDREPDGPPAGGGTGNADVDAVLGRLAQAAGNIGVYEDVHQELRAVLAALDSPPGPVPTAPSAPPAPNRS